MQTKVVWEKYHDELFRFILKRTRQQALAEDLLQDTFLKIHLHLPQLRSPEKLRSWIYKIAANEINTYFKKHPPTSELSITHTTEGSSPPTHEPLDCIPGIIRRLPPLYRNIIYKIGVKGKSQTRIAKETGIPLPTIKSRVQRARKMIQRYYIQCCGYQLSDKGKLIRGKDIKPQCTICF